MFSDRNYLIARRTLPKLETAVSETGYWPGNDLLAGFAVPSASSGQSGGDGTAAGVNAEGCRGPGMDGR